MIEQFRKDALTHLAALLDEAVRFTNPAFAQRRITQCSSIVKCVDEQEQYILRLQHEQETLAGKYADLKERMQRLVYLCESHNLGFAGLGGDIFLTSERLKKIRMRFPLVKLDAIPPQVFDWLVLDELLHDAEQNPNSLHWDRVEQFTKQLEQQYAKQ